MRRKIGWVLQLLVLMFLPLTIGWQLFFGFRLVYMPACVVVATESPCATIFAVAVSSPERCICQLSWSRTQPE